MFYYVKPSSVFLKPSFILRLSLESSVIQPKGTILETPCINPSPLPSPKMPNHENSPQNQHFPPKL